jgi:hypothetical protein
MGNVLLIKYTIEMLADVRDLKLDTPPEYAPRISRFKAWLTSSENVAPQVSTRKLSTSREQLAICLAEQVSIRSQLVKWLHRFNSSNFNHRTVKKGSFEDLIFLLQLARWIMLSRMRWIESHSAFTINVNYGHSSSYPRSWALIYTFTFALE